MNCRVSIAKHGVVFWSSRWVSPERAEVIRQKNQRLVDANRWEHVITIETQLTTKEKLEAARNLEGDATVMAVGGGGPGVSQRGHGSRRTMTRCRLCGLYDGAHAELVDGGRNMKHREAMAIGRVLDRWRGLLSIT